MSNLDSAVVDGFGDEWSRFDQSELTDADHKRMFDDYFHIFPWERLPAHAVGMDIGCGSGRWAMLAAPRVGMLHCVDPSADALAVARRNAGAQRNAVFHHAGVDELPVPDGSLDFAYCLGVLHHIPDTLAGMRACVAKLKPGAPFLVYLYYRFDNRPAWFRALWRASDVVRRGTSRLPHRVRYLASQAIAAGVYWPLARSARAAERLGADVRGWPLTWYRDKAFYVLRTDALDRFGTRLEQRFTRAEITAMMTAAGLTDIRFSDRLPFWTAVGIKA